MVRALSIEVLEEREPCIPGLEPYIALYQSYSHGAAPVTQLAGIPANEEKSQAGEVHYGEVKNIRDSLSTKTGNVLLWQARSYG
jgi:hypothetical protein